MSARRSTCERGRTSTRGASGELSAERADQLAETLGICERVLRRRQILRPDSPDSD
jgi:hypothetical protein